MDVKPQERRESAAAPAPHRYPYPSWRRFREPDADRPTWSCRIVRAETDEEMAELAAEAGYPVERPPLMLCSTYCCEFTIWDRPGVVSGTAWTAAILTAVLILLYVRDMFLE